MSNAAQVFALLGWPLGFSLSPAMHNAGFAAAGVAATYVLRPTAPEDLPAAMDALRRGELAGVNLTVPHKTAVRQLVDDESDLVTAIGAANTIVRTVDGLCAENTDVPGFLGMMRSLELHDGRGQRAVVLGAGGGARAVVYALAAAGYDVTVLSRSTAQAGVIAGHISRAVPGAVLATGWLTPETVVGEAGRADLLVNATPVGGVAASGVSLWPEACPVPRRLTVIDIVAWPPETRLVAQARADGACAAGGLEMLLGQAAAAFELWTGRPAPIEVMRAAARNATMGEPS